jgi:lysophospholipase L1-like esterase
MWTFGLLTAAVALTAGFMTATARAGEPADPARWESTIQKFEAADAKEHTRPGQILFTGSSSIRMWKLPESFGDLDAINRGFGGSHLADVATLFDRVVLPYKPRRIVLYAGENDIAHGASPQQVLEAFESFVKQTRAKLGDTPIVFLTLKPSVKRWEMWPQMKQANDLIAAAARSMPGVTLLRVEDVMLGEDGKPDPSIFTKDNLHMNAEGYVRWKNLVEPFLAIRPQRDQ